MKKNKKQIQLPNIELTGSQHEELEDYPIHEQKGFP